MKLFSPNLLVALIIVISSGIAQSQELKKTTPLSQEELKAKRTPYQKPLSEPSESSPEINLTTANGDQMIFPSSNSNPKSELSRAEVIEEHQLKFQEMIDDFMDRRGVSSATKRRSGSAQFHPELKPAQEVTGSQESSDDLLELKKQIHQRNIHRQKEIIESGGRLEPVEMGPYTGLDKKRTEKTINQQLRERETVPLSVEAYSKQQRIKYEMDKEQKRLSRQKSFASATYPTYEPHFVTQQELSVNRPDISFEVPSGSTYDTTSINGYPTILISDGGNGLGTNTFTTDYVYILQGLCFVMDGQTLSIDPGVVIKGAESQSVPSMLVVAVGGVIQANGTSTDPIVFTAESDEILPPATANNRRGTYDEITRGLWGGVAILGDALINDSATETALLGDTIDLPNDSRLTFGGGEGIIGNAGVEMSYVSIRHAGEYNGSYGSMSGLTLAGVTNEAIVNHVEVFGSDDDGFEFLGGNVNASQLIVVGASDDGFDTDFGYTGKLQYLFGKAVNGYMGEHDGGIPEDTVHGGVFAYNATFIGDYLDAGVALFRDNARGHYYKSIFTDFNTGIGVEYIDTVNSSYDHLVNNELQFGDNIFWNTGAGDYLLIIDNSQTGYFGDIYTEPGLFNNSYEDPLLDAEYGTATSLVFDTVGFSDDFWQPTVYPGAFEPGATPWYDGWSLINAPASIDVDADDYNALIVVRDQLGGGLVDDWVEGNAPSTWPNVDFDGNGKVTALYLDNYGLSGDVPTEFTTLDQLRFLSIGGNDITSFPEGFGNLDSLEQIYAWGNQLTDVPSDFFDLAIVYNIDLSGNQLANADLTGLTNVATTLTDLNLAANDLPAIPSEVYSLTNLLQLYLDGNQISFLDDQISNLSNLEFLTLGYNAGLGDLPGGLGSLSNLHTLNIYEAGVSSFPDMSGLTNLRNLSAWNNNISNDFSTFTTLNSIEYLDLYNNQIGGTLDGIGNLANLYELRIGNNSLTGGIPADISGAVSLEGVFIESNALDGAIEGAIFELPNINSINLNGNFLSGEFPTFTGNSNLVYLDLGSNSLTSLSDGIGQFPNLEELSLHGNLIADSIPAAIANDTSLVTLSLQYNQLTGAIPAEFGNLSQLNGLYLTGNQLNEPLPTELGNLPNLSNLAIDQNQIPGVIPASFANLTNLYGLYIYDNQLTGLPDLSGLPNLGEVYGYNNYFEFDDIEPLLQTTAGTIDFYPQYIPEPELSINSIGSTVTLDATVGGAANNYQWYFNGNFVEGATNPQLVIEDLELDSAGTYWCLIDNDSVNNAGVFLELESGEQRIWISAPANESDSTALVAIYDATQGQNWNNSANWKNAPLVMWEGVFLDGSGRVTMLDLTDKNMQGGLPPAIGDLDALEWLSIWNNENLSYLPGEFYGLPNLHYLDMNNVGVEQLSPAIGLLSSLDTLWIGSNSLSDGLPAELFDLTNLQVLEMANTQLSEIPEGVTTLTNLRALWLNNNQNMAGVIPANIGDLTNLEYLNLNASGALTGEIPSSIANMSNLEYLYVNNTNFTGGYQHIGALTNLRVLYVINAPAIATDLPDSYSNLVNLENFVFGVGNYAPFPPEVLSMTNLKVLQAPEAGLTEIPVELGTFDSLYYINFRNNSITGAFPVELNQQFQFVYIQENEIDDISALEQDSLLTSIIARGNNLDFQDLLPFQTYFENINNGFIPGFYDVAYMKPTNMEFEDVILNVGDTYTMNMGISTDTLTFIDWYQWGSYIDSGETYEIFDALNPDSDGEYIGYAYHDVITNLTGLQLETGIYNVNVIESVSEADSLALEAIYNALTFNEPPANWFEGPVETWQGVFAFDGHVRGLTAYNVSAESFPAAVADLDSLEFLDVYYSDFQFSSIPVELFELSNIHVISMPQNNFAGPLPAEVGNATSLSTLDLSNNFLSGDLPATLSNLTNLYFLNLRANRLTGSIPSGFQNGQFGEFYIDHNYLIGLPDDLDSAIQYASVDFSYNNLDATSLIDGVGNLFNGYDNTYGPQANPREITFTGDPVVGGEVTLHAERLDPSDEFYWYRSDKNSIPPYYFEIDYTGSDSSYTFTINEEFDLTNYIAVIVNPGYQNGSYPFLTKQIAVDSYAKRYVSAQESPEWTDPSVLGFDNDAILGSPDVPPVTFDGSYGRYDVEWYFTDKWWHNASQPEYDTLKTFYDSAIAINYVRLHSPGGELNIANMILRGSGGEEIIVPVNREIYIYENQITFPKTSFAVDQVDFVVSNGSVDAIEIGDTGSDEVSSPQLNSADAGPDFIYVDVQYEGFANAFVVERSTDEVNFEVQDTIFFRGWYYNEVPSQGTYYYRAKALLSAFGDGAESGYSDTLRLSNCEPTIPVDQSWTGAYKITGGQYDGLTGQKEVELSQYSFNSFRLSDVVAGFYDDVIGSGFDAYVEFVVECDTIRPINSFNSDVHEIVWVNDTLYLEFTEYLTQTTSTSKFWASGGSTGDLGTPQFVRTNLISSDSIEIVWDYYGGGNPSFVVQRSASSPTSYTTLDTVSGFSYKDVNTLDGQRYYYRVMAQLENSRSLPSNEPNLIHKSALFEPLSNTITKDLTRTSYGGAWGDYDRDGDDDLYVTNAFELAANFMYENTGNGTFKKIIGTVATTEIGFNRTAIWGDYDNDGFLDLYVPGSRDYGDRVYRNTGSRSFEITNTQVSEPAHEFSPSEAGIWVDVNSDGFLDLVKSVGTIFLNDGDGNLNLADTLHADDGSLTSQEIYFWTVSNVDIDNDNDQDLYITSDVRNMLFVNDGSGSFTYVENEISNFGLGSRGYTWADFNNDGWVDLVTGNQNTETLGLYANRGDGTFDFIPVWSLLGIPYSGDGNSDVRFGRGFTSGDLNNDGRVDLIWTVNDRAYPAMNQGNLRFKVIYESDQAFPITNNFSHISLGDMDKDGFLDVFLPNQTFTGANYIYRNNSNSNSWITVNLKGVQSNSYGIGAKVGVKSNGAWQYQRVTTQNGISSSNSLSSEFGLGSASIVDSVMVTWPSGLVTYDTDKTTNQIITMTEVPQDSGPTVNVTDSLALVALYDSTNGDGWLRKEGWKVGSPLTWEGTYFTPNGRLLSVVLNDNNLEGVIPPAIGTMDTLQILDLSGNNLTGRIPTQIGNITTLVNLSLNDNQLEGTIPGSVGSLNRLENLDLYNNAFIGELPRTLGGLTNLRQFEIYNNGFNGFIPAEIGTLANLQILRMDHNDFEGPLPSGLGGMASLSVLAINNNFLTEELPAELSQLSNLLIFQAQDNEFFGELPSDLADLTGIEVIDIRNNMLEGSLAPFAALDSVRYINASGNRFVDLTDFSDNSADSIIVRGNSLDFGDYELNNSLITSKRLFITPQDSLFERTDSLHAASVALEIYFEVGGSFNSYEWLFNGSVLETGNGVDVFDNQVIIANPDGQHEGEYILRITNSNYPGVTLITQPFNLKITSLERDKRALLAFLAATNNGEFPYNPTGWSAEAELTADTWEGVELSESGDRVIALRLPAVIDTDLSDGNQSRILDGQVPLSFADLSGMQEVDLKGNFLRSFPNVSKWSALESIDISNNRLAFKDIIPNVDLPINYVPQRRYDVTKYDTIAAGSNYIVSINMSGTGLQYQWQFGAFVPGQPFNNNVSPITDANSRVYTVESVDYTKMGTYRVDITHPKVPDLTITSRNRNLMATTDVFGTVFADDQGTLLTDSEVITYRLTPDGPFVPEDTVVSDGGGVYSFEKVILGDFLLQVKPNRSVYPLSEDPGALNVIQTYFEQSETFGAADTLEVRKLVTGIDINMLFNEVPIPVENGADFIGEVTTDLNPDSVATGDEESRISARRKVKRAACSIRRFVPRGRTGQDDEDGTYELYAYVESDDNGAFQFTDIEEGKYRLSIEYPGVPMDPDSDIFFEVGGDKENQLFTIAAEITEDGIVVQAEEVLYTLKPYIKDVQLYPNPTMGELVADFLVYRKLKDLKVQIMDARGVFIFEKELNPRMGTQRVELDLSEQSSGVYFLTFTDESGTFRHQVKVSKY